MNDDPPTRSASNGEPDPAGLHPIDWTVRAGAADDVLEEMRALLRRRRRRIGAAAVAAVALVLGGMIWHASSDRPGPGEGALSATAVVSRPVRQLLPDGSVVELRDGAEISPAFTASQRRVVLTHGEALFHVTKNPRKPFVVQAGAVQVRAVGTAFAVDLSQRTVEVLVTEGRVAVDRASGAEPAASALVAAPRTLAFVDAGNRIVVNAFSDTATIRDAAQVSAVSHAELDARLAWLVPRLEFSGTPLDEVIPMINRFGKVRLVLGDAELGRIHLSGVIRADNVDNLVRLLEEEHGIRAERRDENEIVLTKPR